MLWYAVSALCNSLLRLLVRMTAAEIYECSLGTLEMAGAVSDFNYGVAVRG
jgi:hypothetical protein